MKTEASSRPSKQIKNLLRDALVGAWVFALEESGGSRKIDDPPTPFEMWEAGKPSSAMLENLPPKVAEVGKKRIILLCKVCVSARRASMKLFWKGRRVKYKRPGVPDHSVNVLRRIEAGEMGLNDEGVRAQIKEAVRLRNVRWFIRFGKALEVGRSPKTRVPDFFPERIDRVAQFLVDEWFWSKQPDHVPLCYFTDQALADYSKAVFPTASPTLDSVRKWRKRLGLLRPGPPLIKSFRPSRAVDKK